MNDIGAADCHEVGRRLNNWAENFASVSRFAGWRMTLSFGRHQFPPATIRRPFGWQGAAPPTRRSVFAGKPVWVTRWALPIKKVADLASELEAELLQRLHASKPLRASPALVVDTAGNRSP